jgi:hypothetical protein
MNSREIRQFEMLGRVRNFGNTHAALFASSPVAQQTFAAVARVVDELATTNMQKMSASVSARADRKAVARKTLTELLRKASMLARTLRAEGREMPGFVLPVSRSDVSLVTAGQQFAVDAAAFETEFSGHGMGSAHLAATTAAFEAAASDQGSGRTQHVAARARIHELLTTAIRGARRLDLIVTNELAADPVVQAQWSQLRRLEEPRASRTVSQPAEVPMLAPQSA